MAVKQRSIEALPRAVTIYKVHHCAESACFNMENQSDNVTTRTGRREYEGLLCYASSFLHVLASFNITWVRQTNLLPGPTSLSMRVWELISLFRDRVVASTSQDKHKSERTQLLKTIVSDVWDAKLKQEQEYTNQESRVIKVAQMLEEPQDIDEFIDYFLQELNNDCKREQEWTGVMPPNIGIMFAGQKCIVKCCQSCSNLVHTTFTVERYIIPLSLSNITSKHDGLPCLSDYSFGELLQRTCDECGELCTHEKWLKGDSNLMPNILTIEMSRTIWREGGVALSSQKCNIPFQLLASSIYKCNNHDIYALRAMIVHSEKYGGHYYSVFCTDERYNDWWIADDGDIQKVECISQKLEEISGSWLLVFYEKIGMHTLPAVSILDL